MIEHNLLANCVRESGDHGPWNSWDRIPYITDVFDEEPNTLPPLKPKGKASVVPAWRHIRHNFIMSVYSSQVRVNGPPRCCCLRSCLLPAFSFTLTILVLLVLPASSGGHRHG